MSERIRLSAVFVVAAVLAASAIALKQDKAQAPHGAPAVLSPANASTKKAEEQFKNIQVLKGIPADQLIPTMQFISASLGVECEFCHEPKAFDKDDKKPKQTARKMMEMMFAINKDNFEGHREVTCYSCHRGSPDPVATPIIAAEDAKTAPEGKKVESKDASGPTANDLFDKYLQALGGAAAVEKVTSRVAKGTIDIGGKQVPSDVYSKDPGKRASFMHLPEGDSVTAFDGHEGWIGVPGRPVREMHGSDVDDAAIDADLHFATHLKQMFTEAQVRGIEKRGDHEAYLVVGRREGKPPLRLYFDSQSGLLVRLIRYVETPLGHLPTQIDYADYRDVGGLKVPFRWTVARPSGRFTIQVTDAKQNVPVDDAKFARPPAAPEESNAPPK